MEITSDNNKSFKAEGSVTSILLPEFISLLRHEFDSYGQIHILKNE